MYFKKKLKKRQKKGKVKYFIFLPPKKKYSSTCYLKRIQFNFSGDEYVHF